jgi:hypothetical protein
MKRIFVLVAFVFTIAAARADLVMEQKIDSAMIKGNITTKIKGDKVRVDIPTTPQGAISTIMDVNTGDSVTLMHGQKAVIKISSAEIRQMAENMKKARANGAATNAEPPKFHDTGKAEKVAITARKFTPGRVPMAQTRPFGWQRTFRITPGSRFKWTS